MRDSFSRSKTPTRAFLGEPTFYNCVIYNEANLKEVAALELVDLKVDKEKKIEEAKGNKKVLRFADGHQLYIDDGRLGSGPGWAAFNKENHSSNDAHLASVPFDLSLRGWLLIFKVT